MGSCPLSRGTRRAGPAAGSAQQPQWCLHLCEVTGDAAPPNLPLAVSSLSSVSLYKFIKCKSRGRMIHLEGAVLYLSSFLPYLYIYLF